MDTEACIFICLIWQPYVGCGGPGDRYGSHPYGGYMLKRETDEINKQNNYKL